MVSNMMHRYLYYNKKEKKEYVHSYIDLRFQIFQIHKDRNRNALTILKMLLVIGVTMAYTM